LQQLRGKDRIAMIFQDPMMTLNPVLRVDTQMIEAIQAHRKVSAAQARARAHDALGHGGHSVSPPSGCWPTRTSCRAACASVWRLPLHC
jgi:ABC-type microcin C transport system duplicated ATPase subunit YejF